MESSCEESQGEKEEELITIHVKSMEFPVLIINVSPSQSINSLKQMIIEQLNVSGKTIRLISQGKLLDDQNTVKTSQLKNNCFIHCAISQHISLDIPPADTQPQQPTQLHGTPVQHTVLPNLLNNRIAMEGLAPRLGNEEEEEREDAAVTTISSDVLIGFALGFLLGLIVLLWLWDRNIPRQIKLGIIAGVGLNAVFGLFKLSTSKI